MSDNSKPIVIGVGEQSKRRIRKLRRGEGKLVSKVLEAIQEARPALVAGDSEVLPVVLMVEKKRSKTRRRKLFQ